MTHGLAMNERERGKEGGTDSLFRAGKEREGMEEYKRERERVKQGTD